MAEAPRDRVPPEYRRQQPIRCPKLDAFTGVIDQILHDDQPRPKKQRHTAKRIWERLRAEYAFTGGYTIVKDYVREKRLGRQEMFVPLTHPPGDAPADFGEALVVIDGVECKAHDLVVDLPHSDDAFVKAFPAETTEAFCDGHNAAFRYFGGVPRGIVYDNTKLAVAKILGDRTRQRTQVFSELQSHYLFDDRLRAASQGQRQREGGRSGRLRPTQLVRADPARHQLGRVERRLGAAVPGPSRAPVTAALRDDRGTLRARPPGVVAVAAGLRMRPATRARRGSRRCRWCATGATTTRCRPPTATARWW